MDVLQGLGYSFTKSQAEKNNPETSVKYQVSTHKLEWQDEGGHHAVDEDAVICISPGGTYSERYLVFVLDPHTRPFKKAENWVWAEDNQLHVHWIDQRLPPGLQKYLLRKQADLGKSLTWIDSKLSGVADSSQFFEYNLLPGAIEARNNGLVNMNDHPLDVLETDSERFINNFAATRTVEYANKGEKQTIVLLSGDGGIVDLINGLLRVTWKDNYCPPTVGLLPFGTGNALAHSSGITWDSTQGLRTLYLGEPQPLPMFKVNFQPRAEMTFDQGRTRRTMSASQSTWGAVVCSWGLHASLVADSDTAEYRKHGVERFKMAAKELLTPSDGSESHKYKGKVSRIKIGPNGDEEVIPLERTEHMYVVLSLVSSFEKNFMISPASKPLDGKLRLVHFGAMPPEEVMRILTLAYQGGKHVEEAAVGYEEVDGLRIEMEEEDARWRRVCVDGKIIEVEKGGCVEVRKEPRTAVNLILPRPGDAIN